MKRILRFKHWQLFLLIVITGAWKSPSPLMEIINSISLITFTIWIYAIGIYGQEKAKSLGLPVLNTKLFKTNILLIPVLIIIAAILAPKEDDEPELNLQLILLIPVTFYAIYALFQTAIFACKTLSTLELKREVAFSDYFVNLILVGVTFVGVWILQPRITKLIADNETILNDVR